MSYNPLISIIIPIYRVEQYLRECVDSVIVQTYENLEIILVDDGSPDNCPAICDEYAAKDSRVRVIHRSNGGLSAARNSGIDVAQGEYITFIDSDDYVSRTYVEQLYTTLKNSGAGISECLSSSVDDGLDEAISPDFRIYSAHDAIREALDGKFIVRAAWGKLYPISIFNGQRGRVRYPEGQIMEDLYVMPKVFDLAGSLALSHTTKYFYRKRSTSIWLKPFNATKLDYFISNKHAEEYLSVKYPDLLKYLSHDYIGCSMYILRSALKSFPEDSTIVQEILHKFSEKYSWNYMFSNKSILSKTLAVLLALMPKITLKLLKYAYNRKRS